MRAPGDGARTFGGPMTFTAAIRHVLGHYATFRGRAGRGEFWWWQLAVLIAGIATSVLDRAADAAVGVTLLGPLLTLALLVPNLAVAVRRLHDSDLAGWWVLVPVLLVGSGFLLLVGAVIALLADGFSESGTSGNGVGVAVVLAGLGALLLLAGAAAQLVLMLRPSTPGPNRFGPYPGATESLPPPPSGYGPGYPPAW